MSDFRLYEIDSLLRDAIVAAEEKIDDSGVIPDDWSEFIETIQMSRDNKCLAVAIVHKEKLSEADAIKNEMARLAKRMHSLENQAESLKNYLTRYVNRGEKLKNSVVAIGWRKSNAVVIDDESKLPETCFKIVKTVSKTYIKEQIEATGDVPGAHIEERQNIQIR